MRRLLIAIAVASLSFLTGVAVVMLNHRSSANSPVNSASQPSSDPNDVKFHLDFAEVFRGFDFVGSSIYRTERDACPYGLNDSRPLSEVFEEGRVYVFHCRDSADRDPQFDALQSRFRSLGIETSVSGYLFSGMRLHPDILLFQGKGYVGNITGHAHRKMSKNGEQSPSWEVSDYVLTIVKEP